MGGSECRVRIGELGEIDRRYEAASSRFDLFDLGFEGPNQSMKPIYDSLLMTSNELLLYIDKAVVKGLCFSAAE